MFNNCSITQPAKTDLSPRSLPLGDISWGGTSATQQQKFYNIDDIKSVRNLVPWKVFYMGQTRWTLYHHLGTSGPLKKPGLELLQNPGCLTIEVQRKFLSGCQISVVVSDIFEYFYFKKIVLTCILGSIFFGAPFDAATYILCSNFFPNWGNPARPRSRINPVVQL